LAQGAPARSPARLAHEMYGGPAAPAIEGPDGAAGAASRGFLPATPRGLLNAAGEASKYSKSTAFYKGVDRVFSAGSCAESQHFERIVLEGANEIGVLGACTVIVSRHALGSMDC
jgi:hypothetical protein